MRRHRILSRAPFVTTTLSLLLTATPLALLPAASVADPPDRPGLAERAVPKKPDRATIEKGYSRTGLHLKFVEGSDFRLRGTRLVSQDAEAQRAVDEVLRDFPGTRVTRLFSRPEAALERDKARIERKSGREQADLNLYYRLRLGPKASAVEVIDALNALDVVEIAYAEPLPMPSPVTPDYTDDQTYAEPAEEGLDVEYARTIPGGRGSNVRIIDIEYSWNVNHEDLSKARAAGAMVTNGTPTDPFSNNDHGTAVVGELVADDNSFGVTGLADQAGLGLTNAHDNGSYDLADAIDIAAAALNDGDVILIEQQTGGVNGCDANQVGCVAVEFVQAFYDAIVAATGDGIIVVEAAGNGSEDLDDPAYDPTFGDRPDSGAIIVGAGNYPGCTDPAHGRRDFSTFGSRVNLHAYGQCVTTTGYGDLFGSSMSNDAYTDTFGGTSSASPMVTSAAAILSSVAQQQGDTNGLTSTEARTMLAVGATPQQLGDGGLAGNIGPMPDLLDALAAYVPTVSVGDQTTPEGTDVTLTASGSDPQGGAVTYAWDLDDDGQFDDGTGSSVSFTRVGQDGLYPVAVQVTDPAGATGTDTATVTVTNVAPTVTVDAITAIDEAGTATVTGTISDPGWQESLSATIDFDDGAGPIALTGTSENTRPNATLSFSVTKQYGDDGSFTVSVTGYDDDTSGSDSESAVVSNVAPTAAIDGSAKQTYDGKSAFVVNAGQSLGVPVQGTDVGSDDLTFSWNWGDGTTNDVQTSLVNHPATDPDKSPSVQPRDVTLSQAHTFAGACLYNLGVTVADDDAGSATASAVVLVTGNATVSRGHGYWLNQYRLKPPTDFTAARLQCYLDIVNYFSRVFSEKKDADSRADAIKVLNAPAKSPEAVIFDQQALGAWLNFANGSVRLGTLVDTDGNGTKDTTFGAAMLTAETVRANPASTSAQVKAQKTIVERISTQS